MRLGNLMKHKITISFLLFVLSLALFIVISVVCNVTQEVFCFALSFFMLIVMLCFLIMAMVFLID